MRRQRMAVAMLAVLLACTGCAGKTGEPRQAPEPIPSASEAAHKPTPAPAQTPATAPSAPPAEPAAAPEPSAPPADLEPVEIEVIAGDVPIEVEEVVTRFGYIWDDTIDPCISNLRDQELLTAINLESKHFPAYEAHIIHFSFQDGPDLALEQSGTFEPYAKVGYGELTGDESPEIIVLMRLPLVNREALEPLNLPFVLTKRDGRYVAMELPKLDDYIELHWSPFVRGDMDCRFPDNPEDMPIYRVPDEWVYNHYTKHYSDKDEILGMSREEFLDSLYERGSMLASIQLISHFAVARRGVKNYLMFRQYVSGFGGEMDCVGYWISILDFTGEFPTIVDKRFILKPNGLDG